MVSKRMTGGQGVVEALRIAGVTRAFGVPGESFLEVLDAFSDSPVEFVATRHEGGAAFMASGFSKMSGEVGVCMGTRAVGSSNLAIGIHTARQDSTPMVAIAGQVNRPFRGREAFQELDLAAVFSHYCKWAVEIDDAARVPEVMQRALNIARSGRPGPVFVSLPEDMLEDEAEMSFAPEVLPSPPYPDPSSLEEVLRRLLGAERPAILAGGGILQSKGAYEALIRFAEAAELPVLTTWRRHDVFPNDHRLFMGSASLGQPAVVWDRLRDTDCLLAVGTRFQAITTRDYTLPSPETQVFQIDADPNSIGRPVPASIGVVSDPAVALEWMVARLPESVPGMDVRRERNMAERSAYVDATTPRLDETNGAVDPALVMATLNEVLPPEAVISSDAGNTYGWLSRYYRFRRPLTYVGPTSGAMGYGLPAAIGAKLARPEAPVVCIAGDGGYMMTFQELETAVRLRTAVVSVVMDNRLYGTIRMHQERAHPGRVVGTELTTPDLAKVAEGFGAAGFLVTEGGEFRPALEAALALDRPSVIQVQVDPDRISVAERLSELGRRTRE